MKSALRSVRLLTLAQKEGPRVGVCRADRSPLGLLHARRTAQARPALLLLLLCLHLVLPPSLSSSSFSSSSLYVSISQSCSPPHPFLSLPLFPVLLYLPLQLLLPVTHPLICMCVCVCVCVSCSRRSGWGSSILLKEEWLRVQHLAQGGVVGAPASCSRRSG